MSSGKVSPSLTPSFLDQFDYGFVVCYNAQQRFKNFTIERLTLWYAVNAFKYVTSCVHEFGSALIARALRCLQLSNVTLQLQFSTSSIVMFVPCLSLNPMIQFQITVLL